MGNLGQMLMGGGGGGGHLVTISRFPWMLPECWQYQSDWRMLNTCIYPLCLSHD